jgi:polyisoprenoid-binding protein YceI
MIKNFRLALGAALLALAVPGFAQLAVAPTGTLRVLGDSTLHKWTVATSTVSLTFVLDAGAPASLADAIKAGKVKTMEARVAVADLKSGESGLDKNMRVAMSADKFPQVTYKLSSYELGKPTEDGTIVAKMSGDLTIAGQTKTVTMDVKFALAGGKAEAKGRYALVMSDYGIKPPTLMLGTIKVRDPVAVQFDLLLTPADAAPKAGK